MKFAFVYAVENFNTCACFSSFFFHNQKAKKIFTVCLASRRPQKGTGVILLTSWWSLFPLIMANPLVSNIFTLPFRSQRHERCFSLIHPCRISLERHWLPSIWHLLHQLCDDIRYVTSDHKDNSILCKSENTSLDFRNRISAKLDLLRKPKYCIGRVSKAFGFRDFYLG